MGYNETIILRLTKDEKLDEAFSTLKYYKKTYLFQCDIVNLRRVIILERHCTTYIQQDVWFRFRCVTSNLLSFLIILKYQILLEHVAFEVYTSVAIWRSH